MSGRELIIYILENGLEDEQVVNDGMFVGYMTLGEAAVHFGVGIETIKTWTMIDMIDYARIDGTIYIPKNAKPNFK